MILPGLHTGKGSSSGNDFVREMAFMNILVVIVDLVIVIFCLAWIEVLME